MAVDHSARESGKDGAQGDDRNRTGAVVRSFVTDLERARWDTYDTPDAELVRALESMLMADREAQPGTKGCVYFVQSGADGPVKIGYTTKAPEARRAQLQIGSPEPLILLGSMPGGREDERTLHLELADHRLGGEWFAPAVSVLALVAELSVQVSDV